MKYLKNLFLLAALSITIASSCDDESITLNPPEWLQGEWYSIADVLKTTPAIVVSENQIIFGTDNLFKDQTILSETTIGGAEETDSYKVVTKKNTYVFNNFLEERSLIELEIDGEFLSYTR